MSSKTEYTCNLCNQPVAPNSEPSKFDTAKGLRLDGGKRLEVHHDWTECPIHLCSTCMTNIADITADLKSRNILRP